MQKCVKRLLVGGLAVAGLVTMFDAEAATPVTFQLNWYAGGPNAGFAAAVAEGYYKDAGLDVTLVQGNGSGNTAQLVASGRAQLAYADAVAVSQLIAKGAPMKIVSTIYQSNPNEVSALKKTGIRSIADLKGKKVGVPSGSSQTTMLPLFLKANHLTETDVNLINMPMTSMVPSLLQGQVDAILGSMDAYQIQLEAQGAITDQVQEVIVISEAKAGVQKDRNWSALFRVTRMLALGSARADVSYARGRSFREGELFVALLPVSREVLSAGAGLSLPLNYRATLDARMQASRTSLETGPAIDSLSCGASMVVRFGKVNLRADYTFEAGSLYGSSTFRHQIDVAFVRPFEVLR